MRKVAISGYFDPIHIGHLEYIRLAKELGEYLIVIVNNDEQASLKKGNSFMCEDDRLAIVACIKGVNEAVLSIDKDETVCKTLDLIKPDIFANGGDRSNSEIPEFKICKENNTKVVDGLGDKIRSSSELTGIR
jgi:D-beta-D-heptose 7-phosphate kinase/D-beta-D-heptose 1-phosphate adenosyltransferase